MAFALKTLVAALLIVLSAEAAKRVSGIWGAALISLPVTTIIAMVFLYMDTGDSGKVAAYARAIPPLLLPSVLFFYSFSFLVELKLGFVMAMLISAAIMLGGYALYLFFTTRLGT